MSKTRTSPIWKISKESIIQTINESNSIGEVISKLGLNVIAGGGYRTFKQRVVEENIDITTLTERSKKRKINNLLELEDIFVRNSLYRGVNQRLKKMLIQRFGFEDKCKLCGIDSKWNGKELSLQLDHINGVNNDNRIENLRILCPNCHSQTETYCGKAKKFKKTLLKIDPSLFKEVMSGNTIIGASKIFKVSPSTIFKAIKYYKIPYVCKTRDFDSFNAVRKFICDKETLEKLVKENPMTSVGRIFGVSDNAIRKRCRHLGINVPRKKKPVV